MFSICAKCRPVHTHSGARETDRAALSQPRRRKGGGVGHVPLPSKKSGKYFSGTYRVKFGHFRPNIMYFLYFRANIINITNIIRLGVWECRVSSPSGVQGRAPAKNGFYAHFRSERSHLEHPFQYF